MLATVAFIAGSLSATESAPLPLYFEAYMPSVDGASAVRNSDGVDTEAQWIVLKGYEAGPVGRRFARKGVVIAGRSLPGGGSEREDLGLTSNWVYFVGAITGGLDLRAGATVKRPVARNRRWYRNRMRLGAATPSRRIRGVAFDGFNAPAARFELTRRLTPVSFEELHTPVSRIAVALRCSVDERLDLWAAQSFIRRERYGTRWYLGGYGVVGQTVRTVTWIDGDLVSDTGDVSNWWADID